MFYMLYNNDYVLFSHGREEEGKGGGGVSIWNGGTGCKPTWEVTGAIWPD